MSFGRFRVDEWMFPRGCFEGSNPTKTVGFCEWFAIQSAIGKEGQFSCMDNMDLVQYSDVI